jgi:hypothetical protein
MAAMMGGRRMRAAGGRTPRPAVERLGQPHEQRQTGGQRQQEDQHFLRVHADLTSSVRRGYVSTRSPRSPQDSRVGGARGPE